MGYTSVRQEDPRLADLSARLRVGVDTAQDEDVRRFLQRNAGGVLADRLRIEWAKALARRGSWTTFAAELPVPSESRMIFRPMERPAAK